MKHGRPGGRHRFGFWVAISAGLVFVVAASQAAAVYTESYIATEPGDGRFALSVAGEPAPLVVSGDDHAGVLRVAKHLQDDMGRVTGSEPALATSDVPAAKRIVLIGTLGKSPLVDQLVRQRKIDVAAIAGRWEAFSLQVVAEPLSGVDEALVIVGSDKRGTIFGMFDLSAQIGVSPWFWWADVPVPKQRDLYVLQGPHTQGEPAVKYRGIFINDEAPALANWMQEKFGGHNHRFYQHVFELILRLRGNYLWPAMWGRSIYEDDPESARLADEYGIVMGTTHHEPLMRAHVDWQRNGTGPWNYEKNVAVLREFWTEGVRRTNDHERIISIGMRGDGDEPMTEEANIALLERIVADQRQIIADVTGKDPAEVPQLWALYKEVQEYYDKGMRVPDDVTLLLCDDNWGNIRKLPRPDDPPRAGGYGIYYHYDYVGDPRNYKWLNTNPIPRVWEQMHLAYRHGVDRIWIVNVGDIKPMELPIEFFLDYAWDPEKWPAERLDEYTQRWAASQFGAEHAAEIARLLAGYTKFNGRRKPELLEPETYSLVNFREAERVVDDYNRLAADAQRINEALPAEYRDAFYQLVLYPVEACANLNELYVTAGLNRLYANQGRAATNDLAERVRELFARDAELSRYYNEELAGGKWNHMMDQVHIGYTYWQDPPHNRMPYVAEFEVPQAAEMGIAIEGSTNAWPAPGTQAALPELHFFEREPRYIEIFNRGREAYDCTVTIEEAWLRIGSEVDSTKLTRRVEKQQRLWVSADWDEVPTGIHRTPITISGPGGGQTQTVVWAVVHKPATPKSAEASDFFETKGYVSIEADHYTRAVESAETKWQRVPDLGRTGSAMMPFPVTADSQSPGGDSPRLEYSVFLASSDEVRVKIYVSPTLNYYNTGGLRYAVSFDEQPPQVVNIHADESHPVWQEWVRNNINVTSSTHSVAGSGEHVLKFWMVDPGIVLQRLVVETGEVAPSYLGPPETRREPASASPPN